LSHFLSYPIHTEIHSHRHGILSFCSDPFKSFAQFTRNLDDFEIVYYDVPLLQFEKIAHSDSKTDDSFVSNIGLKTARPSQSQRDSLRSGSGAKVTDIEKLISTPATKALFQDLQKNLQSIGDGEGKPTVECVTLPFLRSKTSNFLFNGKTPLLFIRSQYITLYDEIRKASYVSQNVFLDGNSGVGKSFLSTTSCTDSTRMVRASVGTTVVSKVEMAQNYQLLRPVMSI
jgi:hypothetical protein